MNSKSSLKEFNCAMCDKKISRFAKFLDIDCGFKLEKDGNIVIEKTLPFRCCRNCNWIWENACGRHSHGSSFGFKIHKNHYNEMSQSIKSKFSEYDILIRGQYAYSKAESLRMIYINRFKALTINKLEIGNS